MIKRAAALLITLALVIAVMPVKAFATSSPIDDAAVYYTPASDYRSGDCILTATKMMIRRAVIIRTKGDWSVITNQSIRTPATISGLLRNSFVVNSGGMTYKVNSALFTGKGDVERIKEFELLLKTHPEGIVVHGTGAASSGTHGVLVVKVVNGVPYAADSSRNTGLYNKGIQTWTETTMLDPAKVTKYWYVSEISASAAAQTGTAETVKTSTLRIKSVKAPKKIKQGKKFSIKGTVKSNKKIKKVTVRVLDSNGRTVLSASKKPNAKSFSIKKLDKKIKFGKLKKGQYAYQIIAADSVQELILVNRPFTVK